MASLPPLYRPAFLRLRGYDRANLAADLAAGALVGVVALPLSMALAIASGCTPEQGLFTAIIGGLIVSLFGGTRVQIGGPAGAFVGLCAAGVNQFGYGGLAIATLMAGALMLFMGLARLGKAITYIPVPVVIGFTTGIAVILASTQLSPALGIADPAKPLETLAERLHYLWQHAEAWNGRALAICAASVALIVVLRKRYPRLPGALIAVAAAGFATSLLGWEGKEAGQVETIATRFGQIPHSLPLPSLPSFGLPEGAGFMDMLKRVKELSELALALAMLGAIESLLSAVVADGMTGDRHDSNSELIGQGFANLLTPFFMGLPVTGVIARTSTNIRAGARTPLAGAAHAVCVLLIMLLAAPFVVHVPLAALAGVLLVVCWYMAELRHWPHILRAGRSDAILLPIAFGLTAFIGLTQAILVGTLLAMFFFVKRMADTTQVEKQAKDNESGLHAVEVPASVEIYEVRGPFFFGAATLIRDLDGGDGTVPRAMILRIRNVPFIDATAAFALRELAISSRKRGTLLIISEIHSRPLIDFDRLGLNEVIGDENIHGSFETALAQARELAAEEPGMKSKRTTIGA